jgi:hypothetical protein
MSRGQNSNNTLPILVHCKKCLENYGALCNGLVAVTLDQALDIAFDRNASPDFRLKDPTDIRQKIVKILTILTE